jgi:hypothetical protein
MDRGRADARWILSASPAQGLLGKSSQRKVTVAKNQNTFEKRRREVEKKQKAADKIERRRKRKERAHENSTADEPIEDDPEDKQ